MLKLADTLRSFVWLALFAGSFVATTASLQAGEYNQVLKIGDTAPTWSDLPGTDDKPHSSSDFKDADVLVVVFTCNSCPVANDYEDRLIAFANKQAKSAAKVALVAINVNKIEADSLPKMKERAEKKSYPYPYIYDESQQIAKDFGAMYTPDVFVLNKDRKVVYMGGIDDNSKESEVKKTYLAAAVAAALAGSQPEVKETLSRGCRIRFARERR